MERGDCAMRRRVLPVALIAIFSLILAGCDFSGMGSSQPRPITSQTKAKGLSPNWVRYESLDEGYTVDLPKSWQKLDLGADDVKAAVDLMRGQNPDLAEFMNSSQFRSQMDSMAKSGVRLILYDSNVDYGTTLFATNMNLVHMEIPGGMKLDDVVDKNIMELRKVLGKGLASEIDREVAKLGNASARKISYVYQVNAGYQYVDIVISQYLTVKDNHQYILTFSTTESEVRWRDSEFDRIARTFKFTE
jgi:hypothetical protein